MIVLKNVTKSYGAQTVLANVSFRLNPQEFLCVTGPSGAGKSTLLSLLIGAEEPTEGTVEVDGVDLRSVPPPAMQLFRRRVGVVFQDFKLLQNRTVEENVAFPLEVCGVSDEVIRKTVPQVLERVGLGAKGRSLPRELSGGEKARAAVARAIIHRPIILLADEPTGNLDPSQSEKVLGLLKEINTGGTTVILATHDSGLVDTLQSRVIRLEEGKIIRDSVGGYTATSSAPRHSVFDGAEQAMEDAAEAASQREKSGQRKIRITAIGS